ncbi:PHP-associated domain-containing protein [Photobacterium damselae subsp. piscicida]|nr:PHP-associated domain-containing protein [Photobacterium damselae subsp. piscicida]MDP2556457.1 PHP-associated domain-containing protein [Photobacterium damselae subsp. piscicida]
MAKELDVFITTGSDAHFAADVGNFTQVKALLKHHNFPQERVITYSPDSFLSFLELRGKELISEFSVNSF